MRESSFLKKTFQAIIKCEAAIDEMKMADLLEKHPRALLLYLRKLIDDKECVVCSSIPMQSLCGTIFVLLQIPQLHTRLALLYLDRISQLEAGDDQTNDDNVTDMRKRLRKFLSQSSHYDVKKVLVEIEGVDHFLSEKAFILGKVKMQL